MARVLTDEDISALATAIKQHNMCLLGISPKIVDSINEFTPEQLGILRRIAQSVSKSANIIGYTVLIGIISAFIGFIHKGIVATILGWFKSG